ncbi:MAG: formylglycine-generating enzyme family protein [Gammaproteobacteria bacterium]|nr:formylglycine-generating enzyme family protein [Gammaproteobacteria bacterium]
MCTPIAWRICFSALLFVLGGQSIASEPLVVLSQPGPWSAVSQLVAYDGRVWFVNSVKFKNHNSADLYSYDPANGATRYEKHLFSQDAGDPFVHNDLLYWPFEDSRFSTGGGEYSVTNGRDWIKNILAKAQAFHTHAMAQLNGDLFAATSAWRAGLQRSTDNGLTWDIVYNHETSNRQVSRITSLVAFKDSIYAGLTSRRAAGSKLLRWKNNSMETSPGWPDGSVTTALSVFDGWLYAVNTHKGKRSVWRTNGVAAEKVDAFNGRNVRAFAAGERDFWAIAAKKESGELLRSEDGKNWKIVQVFNNAQPVDILVLDDHVYVGTVGPDGRGALWGPEELIVSQKLSSVPSLPVSEVDIENIASLTASLENVLQTPSENFYEYRVRLDELLTPLALSRQAEVGEALSKLLLADFPVLSVDTFAHQVNIQNVNRWYLLWAMSLNGHGRIPIEWLSEEWTRETNHADKYFEPLLSAITTVGDTVQKDGTTIDTLIKRLDNDKDPFWLKGDIVGALTDLTGNRFGYDFDAWKEWWRDYDSEMIAIPGGDFNMGSQDGETAERPVHKVSVTGFSIDRFEVTNKEFTYFVDTTSYTTDGEKSGKAWHWDGKWYQVSHADWRHPHGPDSSIQELDVHPVVQVSWNDANAYCEWRGKRLPTEAEWERAARSNDGRIYAWGKQPPDSVRASYGSDKCCAADNHDGFLYTAPVGSFPKGASAFEIQDMTGNVWEWVEDSFDPMFYSRSPNHDPVNREVAEEKVIRGGGWGNNPEGLRTTLRHANPPHFALSMVGFRCAK